MILIQVILIAVIALIIIRLIFKLKDKELNLPQFLGWLAIWLTAVLIIANPQITTYLATRVGIGRGVDLVIYVSVIAIFYLLFRLLLRIGRIEKEITQLVRADALKTIDRDDQPE